jgi:glycosyltransferase involved in cell wall biosynthesis
MNRRFVAVLPSLAGGGAETATLTLARGLAGIGMEVHIVTFEATALASGLLSEEPPVEVHQLRRGRLRAASVPLLGALRRLSPDVVFSSIAYINFFLCATRRAQRGDPLLVLREANMPSASLKAQPWPWLFRNLYRRLYPRADAIVVSSKLMRQELLGFGLSADRVHVIDNPVDVAALRRRAAGAEASFKHDGLELVCAGRLTRQKGFDVLIAALADLQCEWRLHVFGDGPDRTDLERQVQALGLADKVAFHGYRPDLAPWLAGADAVLVPSRWEGMPNVALEALACGTPVIARRTAGGLAELATRTPANALRLYADERELVSLLEGLHLQFPEPAALPRPNLLPPEFEMGAVAVRYAELLGCRRPG